MMTPFDPGTLKQGIASRLAPYGFRKFRVRQGTEKDVIVIDCIKGTQGYLATFHVSMMTEPMQQTMDSLADYLGAQAWGILRSSWGKHVKR